MFFQKSKMKLWIWNLSVCICTGICLENATKYNAIVHQKDIWQGAKIIVKKVISVCTGIYCNYNLSI
jgi:hypothetical protein